MAKNLITRGKKISIEHNNPYRTRSLIFEAKLISANIIEIKVQQIDWTLKIKVDEREYCYKLDSEYDYISLVNHLYHKTNHINQLPNFINTWVEKRKLTFNYPSYILKGYLEASEKANNFT